ncbi:hypothetical protein G7046_g2002 [Stylonectria norvegica]|nr:hypothetical protein G7046_g2002 [Stylonectria norvegica]
MARLADYYPSSDDDLPELTTLLRRTSTSISKSTSTSTSKSAKPTAKSPVKTLVPKSTSKSSTRRVRRLKESAPATSNPLFQRWNSEDRDASRASVEIKAPEPTLKIKELRRRTPEAAPPPPSGSESEEDEPQLRVRGSRKRRPRIIEESDEEESESGSSDVENLLTRIRRLQTAKAGARNTPELPDEVQLSDATATESPSREEAPLQKAAPRTRDQESQSDCEADTKEADAEEPSMYETAEEETSEFSADSASESDFEPDDSPDRPAKTSPPSLLFNPPRKSAETRNTASPVKNAPPLKPNNLSLKTKETTRRPQRNEPPNPQALVKKPVPQRRNPSQEHSQARPSQRPSSQNATASDLAKTLSKLRLQDDGFSKDDQPDPFTTPPSTPPESQAP